MDKHKEPKRPTQKEVQMNAVNGALHELGDCIQKLEDRLCSVLAPPEPLIETIEENPMPVLVPLASQVRSNVMMVGDMQQTVSSLIRRIEL